MRLIPKNWAWPGISLAVLGLALVFGTRSWAWLGALAFTVGIVLILAGPAERGAGDAAAPGESRSRGHAGGHSCCAPPGLAGADRGRQGGRPRGCC